MCHRKNNSFAMPSDGRPIRLDNSTSLSICLRLSLRKSILDLGIEVIPADAADDIEILVQLDLVRGIDAETDSAGVGIRSQGFQGSAIDCCWD